MQAGSTLQPASWEPAQPDNNLLTSLAAPASLHRENYDKEDSYKDSDSKYHQKHADKDAGRQDSSYGDDDEGEHKYDKNPEYDGKHSSGDHYDGPKDRGGPGYSKGPETEGPGYGKGPGAEGPGYGKGPGGEGPGYMAPGKPVVGGPGYGSGPANPPYQEPGYSKGPGDSYGVDVDMPLSCWI